MMIDLNNISPRNPYLVIDMFRKMSKKAFTTIALSSRRISRFIEENTKAINRPIFIQTLELTPHKTIQHPNGAAIIQQGTVELKRSDRRDLRISWDNDKALGIFQGAKVYTLIVNGLWTDKNRILNKLNFLKINEVHELRIIARTENLNCIEQAKLHAKYYHWLCERIHAELIPWLHKDISRLDAEPFPVKSRLLHIQGAYDDEDWGFFDNSTKYLYTLPCDGIKSTKRLQNQIKAWNQGASSLVSFCIGAHNGTFDIDYNELFHSFEHFKIYSNTRTNFSYADLLKGTIERQNLENFSSRESYEADIVWWYLRFEFNKEHRKTLLIVKSRGRPHRFAFVFISPTSLFFKSVDRWKVDKVFKDRFLPILKKETVIREFELHKKERSKIWDEIFAM